MKTQRPELAGPWPAAVPGPGQDALLPEVEWAAEAIGWQPLGERAYLHLPQEAPADEPALVIEVVGVPTLPLDGLPLLLVT